MMEVLHWTLQNQKCVTSFIDFHISVSYHNSDEWAEMTDVCIVDGFIEGYQTECKNGWPQNTLSHILPLYLYYTQEHFVWLVCSLTWWKGQQLTSPLGAWQHVWPASQTSSLVHCKQATRVTNARPTVSLNICREVKQKSRYQQLWRFKKSVNIPNTLTVFPHCNPQSQCIFCSHFLKILL